MKLSKNRPITNLALEMARIFTARKRSLGQGNIFRSVCQEFCPQGGGVSASVHAGMPHPPPPGADPLGADTPSWSRHPPESILGDTVNARAVRILLRDCESATSGSKMIFVVELVVSSLKCIYKSSSMGMFGRTLSSLRFSWEFRTFSSR